MQGYQEQPATSHTARNIALLLLGLVVAVGIFTAGIVVGSSLSLGRVLSDRLNPPGLPTVNNTADDTADDDANLDPFWEVWNTLESRFYYDLPTEEERVQGAIFGLMESLDDPYSAYIPPDAARILSEDSSGSFEGIGAFVQEAPDGGVYIVRVFDEGPAKEAGVQAGDVIIAVDGEDVTNMALQQALLLIRGEAGSTVNLTIFREDESDLLEFNVERARLDVPTVQTEMLEDNIGYVALFDFNARASARLRDAVRELLNDGAESIVLDLRNNPGGFLDEAISVSDLFLESGTVVLQRDVDGRERTYSSGRGELAEDVPLVVLINENSASASEIVAAAIQDNERGTLIGVTSFGKGSVQLQYDLSDGSLLRVTYAAWYTPDDESINGNGVAPDIVVEAPEDADSTEDPQLDRAVEFLQEGQ